MNDSIFLAKNKRSRRDRINTIIQGMKTLVSILEKPNIDLSLLSDAERAVFAAQEAILGLEFEFRQDDITKSLTDLSHLTLQAIKKHPVRTWH